MSSADPRALRNVRQLMSNKNEVYRTYILRSAIENAVVCRLAKTLSNSDEVVSLRPKLTDRIRDDVVPGQM